MRLESGRWAPGIGDPTIMGWLTVAAYLLCAVLCLWAATRRQPIIYRREELDSNPGWFWIGLSILLIALGINKQLDLQSLLTQVGQEMAIHQGWYEYRRQVQFMFILGLAGVGSGGLWLGIRWLRHTNRAVKLALGGCVFLFAFVLIRASSFHHMDTFLGVTFGGARMNWIFELGSLGVIFVAAILVLIRKHRQF